MIVKFVCTAAILCIAAKSSAFTTGIANHSGNDGQTCTKCHAAGAAAQPSAQIKGPSALTVGGSAEYQLVIDTDVTTSATAMNPTTRAAGLDVAASGGKLGVVPQVNETRLIADDISHTNALPKAKTIAISFSLTAPADPGTVTLFAAALSADGNGSTSGDATATTTFTVNIVPPGSALDMDVVTSASPREEPDSPDMGPPRDEARWSCGSTVGHMPVPMTLLPLALVLLLAIALRQRNHSK
jgi:hypothetical protein